MGMTRFQIIVEKAMNDRGWSPYDLEQHGGPNARTTYALLERREWRQPPKAHVVDALAAALDLPHEYLRSAARETTAGGAQTVVSIGVDEDAAYMAAVMRELADDPALRAELRQIGKSFQRLKRRPPPDHDKPDTE